MNKKSNERRTVRYTLLLTPAEREMLKKVAAREFRTVPDWLHYQIHVNANKAASPKSASTEKKTA